MNLPTPVNPPFSELLAQFRADPRSLLNCNPGIFLLDKPSGITSQAAIKRLQRQYHWKKVGHGGTLDPLATGLLIVLVGAATRLFDEFHAEIYDKEYLADFQLGVRTDSQDITGKEIARFAGEINFTFSQVADALTDFRGQIWQTPPMFSALKRDGKKLVDLARKGETVEREPRRVSVNELELLTFSGTNGRLRVAAGKGFYVRTLINDLGEKLGVGATLTALRRTRAAMFSVDDAVALQ